jgi:hypothetical protein
MRLFQVELRSVNRDHTFKRCGEAVFLVSPIFFIPLCHIDIIAGRFSLDSIRFQFVIFILIQIIFINFPCPLLLQVVQPLFLFRFQLNHHIILSDLTLLRRQLLPFL